MNKNLPFTSQQLAEISAQHATPFHLYDEKGLREHARKFKKHLVFFLGLKNILQLKPPQIHLL